MEIWFAPFQLALNRRLGIQRKEAYATNGYATGVPMGSWKVLVTAGANNGVWQKELVATIERHTLANSPAYRQFRKAT